MNTPHKGLTNAIGFVCGNSHWNGTIKVAEFWLWAFTFQKITEAVNKSHRFYQIIIYRFIIEIALIFGSCFFFFFFTFSLLLRLVRELFNNELLIKTNKSRLRFKMQILVNLPLFRSSCCLSSL